MGFDTIEINLVPLILRSNLCVSLVGELLYTVLQTNAQIDFIIIWSGRKAAGKSDDIN